MEDFSTILWVVIIVGAMIYNSLSKARKTRAKEDNTPSGSGEAWPSIPWSEENAPTRRETAPAPHTTPHTAPVPSLSDMPQPTGGRSATDGKNGNSHPETELPMRQGDPAGTGRTQTGRNPMPSEEIRPFQESVSTVFPDECQSLEEIPDEEYLPEYETAEIPGSVISERFTLRNQPSDNARQTPKAKKGGPTVPENAKKSVRKEESAAELIEEFDLRRAVIYSEILKPKFEE